MELAAQCPSCRIYQLITQIPRQLFLLQMEELSFIITFSILSCCWKTLERLEILIALHCPEFKTGGNGVLYFIHYLLLFRIVEQELCK